MKRFICLLIITLTLKLIAQNHYSIKDVFMKENMVYTLGDSLPVNGKIISKHNNDQLKYEKAVTQEQYEEAAVLRDELRKLHEGGTPSDN